MSEIFTYYYIHINIYTAIHTHREILCWLTICQGRNECWQPIPKSPWGKTSLPICICYSKIYYFLNLEKVFTAHIVRKYSFKCRQCFSFTSFSPSQNELSKIALKMSVMFKLIKHFYMQPSDTTAYSEGQQLVSWIYALGSQDIQWESCVFTYDTIL